MEAKKKSKKRKKPLVSDEALEVDMNLLSPSFKEDKNSNRDELIASFDIDKTKPIDKTDIHNVLEKETTKFKEMPKEDQEIVKKEIGLELLYNYDQKIKREKKDIKYKYLLILLLLTPLMLIIILILTK